MVKSIKLSTAINKNRAMSFTLWSDLYSHWHIGYSYQEDYGLGGKASAGYDC